MPLDMYYDLTSCPLFRGNPKVPGELIGNLPKSTICRGVHCPNSFPHDSRHQLFDPHQAIPDVEHTRDQMYC